MSVPLGLLASRGIDVTLPLGTEREGHLTAEIAILNKSAVALAADSAVTISIGDNQEKVFDSADKLFELTQGNAIGIMINSDMDFMEAPLDVLIKRYRETAPIFNTVRAAFDHFLQYLFEFALKSPQRIQQESLEELAGWIFGQFNDRSYKAWIGRLIDSDTQQVREEYKDQQAAATLATEMHQAQLEVLERAINGMPDAQFVGDGDIDLSDEQRVHLAEQVARQAPMSNDLQRARILALVEVALRKVSLFGAGTGVVIAGFGSDDLFPTLLSFELHGVVCNRLKFVETNFVDIDRDGHRARVLPFAQGDMVERFLYGLDSSIENSVVDFCRDSVRAIADRVLDQLDMPDGEKADLIADIVDAEAAFVAGLRDDGFEAIRAASREEIEVMVEFMPKPEMARMAEALINLTSIKRRVSRGRETVAGPIDVAVISKAEGFVWVRRKHYFPAELNGRYFGRMRREAI